MAPLTSLVSDSRDIVLDASVVINIVRSGISEVLLSALPNKFLIPDAVAMELKLGADKGQPDFKALQLLSTADLVKIVPLDPVSDLIFERLTIGASRDTLDDGEAATIALAIERGGVALIDERKGISVATANYPLLPLRTTIDLLGHPKAFEAVGSGGVADAVFSALTTARMSVTSQHLNWVVPLIGKDRAATCVSISKPNLQRVIKDQKL